jgi:hypothetical protein
MKTDLFGQLPVTGGYRISPIDRHPARARDCAYTPKPGNQVVTGNSAPPSSDVTILRHCRCMDCTRFSKVGGEYFCSEYISGTSVVWATGKRECDPPSDAWHYCSRYDGPQISTDVWVWTRETHKKWPAPGGGRPGGGPNSSRLAGGEPAESESDSTKCEDKAIDEVTSEYQRSTVERSAQISIARDKDAPGDAPTRTQISGTSTDSSAVSTHHLDRQCDASSDFVATKPSEPNAAPSRHVPPRSTIAPKAAQGYDSAKEPLLMERCTSKACFQMVPPPRLAAEDRTRNGQEQKEIRSVV